MHRKNHFSGSRLVEIRSTLLGLGLLAVAGCAPQLTDGTTPPAGAAQALGPHQPARVLHSTIIGRVDPTEQIDLVLGLRVVDRAGIDRLIKRQADPRSGSFRSWLTPAQFAEQFAVTAAQYDAVAEAATQDGFVVTRRVDGRTTLSVRGTAETIERVFGTRLEVYQDRWGGSPLIFRAPSHEFRIPDELGLVETVVGLDTARPWKSHMKKGGPPIATSAAGPGSQAPTDLRTRYGVTGATNPNPPHQALDGAGETIVILGAGNPPKPKDVSEFIAKYPLGTNQAAQYTQILLGGPTREPSAEAGDEYYENVLDIDMVMTMAPAANYIHVVTAMNAGGLFEDGIAFVVNQVPQAHAVTVSYGTCERVNAFFITQSETLLAQGKAQGQAWFFSSGDNGTDTCKDVDPSNPPNSFVLTVDYPASSPNGFGVGGTQISTAFVEQAWDFGGGGLSEVFPTPSWQQGVGPYQNQDARRVPDVAALAGDPGVVTIIDQGGPQIFVEEGTSAAAPMWGGIWALIDQSKGNVGIADYQTLVYGLAGVGFNDITTGSNTSGGATQGYSAVVGYDLATGWGTPNLPALVGGLQ